MAKQNFRGVTQSYCTNRRVLLALFICIVGIAIVAVSISFSRKHVNNEDSARNRGSSSRLVWRNMRLPDSVIPIKYEISLNVDMNTDYYHGIVRININITNQTNLVVFHEVKLNLTSIKLQCVAPDNNDIVIEKQYRNIKNQLYVLETRDSLERNTSCILTIKFNSYLRKELSGFYASYYVHNKTKKKTAVTFFSPISARKAFPCFDEPKFKAVFLLSLTHSDKYTALANMPVKTKSSVNNLVTTTFYPTLKMSTYILCWTICSFREKSGQTDKGLQIKAWAPAEKIEETTYALKIFPVILKNLENYFQIDFPLNKLDMVAIENFGPSAMENWGLITFESQHFLINKHTATDKQKQKCFEIMIHELVHQWFGNLATMNFWTDLWLKEGFASYITYYIGNQIDPDIGLMSKVLNRIMLPAMITDSYSSSHPISVEPSSPGEILQQFDTISYQKGSCIVQMLHQFLGKEDFRKGLQKYLTVYSYRNADQEDLWRELSIVSKKRVKDVMDTWTLQLGYPVITLKRENRTHIHIKQQRYSLDAPDTVVPSSPFNYTWHVPIIYRPMTNKNITYSYLLKTKDGYLTSEEDVLLNLDHASYYRVNYETKMMDKLKTILYKNISNLSIQDRTGLISDTFSMVDMNLSHIKDAMELLQYLKNEEDYYPWKEGLTQILKIYDLTGNSEIKLDIRRLLLNLTHDKTVALGWKKMDSFNSRLLQVELLKTACLTNNSHVVKNATSFYKKWMAGTSVNIEKNLLPVMRGCAIRHGANQFWDFAYQKYTEGGSEKNSILNSLTETENAERISKLLNISLNPNKIDPQEAPRFIGKTGSKSRIGRHLAWKFVKENWSIIYAKYGNELFLLDTLLLSLLENFDSKSDLNDIVNFFSTQTNLGIKYPSVKDAISAIKSRILWKKSNEQKLLEWLRRNV